MPPQAAQLPDPDRHAAFYDGTAAKRGFAWLTDTILTAVLTAMIVPFTAFVGLFFLPILYALVNTIYRWGFLASQSATPGMALAGIVFRGADGQPLDAGTAFLHTAGYVVSWAVFPCQIVSVVLMATSARGQGLSDMILGTVAINRPGRV
ncbi:MAG: RDD family protein [Gemmobacter sp.]